MTSAIQFPWYLVFKVWMNNQFPPKLVRIMTLCGGRGVFEMKDVSIPLPDFVDRQIAEIEVKINGKKRQYNFRVESFRWEPDDEEWTVEMKIHALRDGLEKYDGAWELIQIFKPKEGSKFVQVLYRQRQAQTDPEAK